MTLADRIAAQERRALRQRAAYVAAVGTLAAYAAPVPPVSEWVRRAQECRLPVKEYAR